MPEQPPTPPSVPGIHTLTVVTALLCTPREFPGELGEDYPTVCAHLRVSARPGGYGLLLCQDVEGARWTAHTTDTNDVVSLRAMWATSVLAGYEPSPRSVVAVQAGWPVECSMGLVDRSRPYDPPGHTVVLAPPDLSHWGPAARRHWADRIADELLDPPGWDPGEFAMHVFGDTDLQPRMPRLIELVWALSTPSSQDLVDAAIAEAWRLAAQTPPVGRIRTIPLGPTGSGRRLVRASGSTWSLLAARDRVGLICEETGPLVIDIAHVGRVAELFEALAAAAERADQAFTASRADATKRRRRRRPGR